jgi:hypothetical protein
MVRPVILDPRSGRRTTKRVCHVFSLALAALGAAAPARADQQEAGEVF